MSVIIDIIQWKHHQKKDGSFPIKLRVQHKSEAKYYPILYNSQKLSLTEGVWEEVMHGRPKGEHRKIYEKIREDEARAYAAVDKVTSGGRRPFSYIRFKEEFGSMEGSSGFFRLFDKILDELLKEDRVKTNIAYSSARSAFWAFLEKEINMVDITPTLLKKFEAYLIQQRKVGKNTIAIYMRTLRMVYNRAISETPYLLEFYPFATKRNDKNKYQIRTGKGKKGDALTKEQLVRFIQAKVTPGGILWEAKLLWLFSLYCQGMNFKDLALLTPGNIKGDVINYVRHKTKNTEFDETPIMVPISEAILNILKELGCNLTDPKKFVFPIITHSMDQVKIEKVINQKIKNTNERLRKLCDANDLPPITTYWARHTYATTLKRLGVDTELIREALGHSSSKVTTSYLAGFDLETQKKANAMVENIALYKAAS